MSMTKYDRPLSGFGVKTVRSCPTKKDHKFWMENFENKSK